MSSMDNQINKTFLDVKETFFKEWTFILFKKKTKQKSNLIMIYKEKRI